MRSPSSPVRVFGAFAVASLAAVTFAPLGCGGSSDGLGAVTRDGGGGVVVPPDEDGGGVVIPVDPGSDDGGTTGGPDDGGGPIFADADITPDATGCTNTPPTRGPYPHTCKPATTNECDGAHDFSGFANNGTGNGYDDDCDGLVDEGCACPSPGVTKTCFLVPGSQIDGTSKEPVGWCKTASRGTVDCVGQEFPKWSGVCRGASPPFADDKCAPGDYDCDGRDLNSFTKDCSCQTDAITCPTAPFITAPYPNPANLPLKIDASLWFGTPSNAAQATNWTWTMRGGDCDNIQPHPSFGIYKTNSGAAAPLGRTVTNLGPGQNEHGRQVTQAQDGVTSSVYPAFSLSGDYVMDVSLDFAGQHYTCSLNIKAQGPGLRAEACWDTMGNTDVDLHMAKVNGFSSCAHPGWSDTCASEDCLWSNCKSDQAGMSRWYAASPTTACVGWGSLASGACPNPRLDRDNISCTTTQQNPNGTAALPIPFPFPLPATSDFCGSENINVDNPNSGDTFAVGTVLYSGTSAKPHINVYCNGQRIVSAGYNPLTGSNFPVLRESGGDNGDFWKFGLVKVTGSGANIACDVTTTTSVTPIGNKDGSTSFCVDKGAANSTTYLSRSGGTPSLATDLCFH